MSYRETRVVVDLSAIRHNVRALQALVGADVQLMAVVKANAYGHGMLEVARAALDAGAKWLGVAIAEEGKELREAGITAPILVLGGMNENGAAAAVRYRLTQTVFDEQGIKLLQVACEAQKATVDIHLKCDTGMGRIGVRSPQEVQAVLQALSSAPLVHLRGVYTHFANADAPEDAYSSRQLRLFDALCEGLPKGLMRHAAASAGTLRYRNAHFDMVRIGIAMYGCPPLETAADLRPALSWHTQIAYIKDLSPGDFVSYGCTFCAKTKMRVATLPVGYGDGYHRALSGKAFVLVGGVRCPVLGRVCMDQMMADITTVPSAKVYDPVVLIGTQGQEHITADELAALAGTISYEMLLAPTPRVPVTHLF